MNPKTRARSAKSGKAGPSQSKSMSAAGGAEVSTSSFSCSSLSSLSSTSFSSFRILFSSGSRPSVLSGGTYFPYKSNTVKTVNKEEKKHHLVQPAQPHAASLDAAAKLGDDQEVGEVAAASLHLQDQLQPNVGGAMIGEMLKYWVGNHTEFMAAMGLSDPS